MYESDKWRIGYETFYTGKQFLSNGTETTDFVTMGLLLMHNFKFGSAFVNFENFTDTRQTRFENINTGTLQNPQFRDVYAPLDGFVINGGFRIQW